MLTRLTAGEVPAHFDAFWPAALDLRRSGYPTYTDGIKNRADWEEHILRAAKEDWGEVLLHRHDGQPNGLIAIELADEEYLSLPVCICGGHQRDMLEELLEYLTAHHPGRTLWMGFAPENDERLAFARERGFELLDDTVNWNIRDWRPVSLQADVQRVTAENYAHFRSLWTDETIYWNAERIEAAFDKWLLFTTDRAAVACMDEGVMLEIFGVMGDAAHMRRLMEACLNASGGRPLTYFASQEEAPVMESLGFRRISGYVCYQKTL